MKAKLGRRAQGAEDCDGIGILPLPVKRCNQLHASLASIAAIDMMVKRVFYMCGLPDLTGGFQKFEKGNVP